MVFLELRRDSRVTTGNSGCLLCWPREVQSSIRVAKESWGLPKLIEFSVGVNVDTGHKRAEECILEHSTGRGQENEEEQARDMKVSSW